MTLFVVFGLPVPAWPLLATMSGFLFDSPVRSTLEGAVRNFIFWSVILYPIVWGLALFFSIKQLDRRSEKSAWILALVPAALIALVVLVGFLWGKLAAV